MTKDDETIEGPDWGKGLGALAEVPFQHEALTLVLEKIRVALAMHVSPEVLEAADISLRADSIAGHVLANFEMWLWSNTIHKETQVTYVPETWWDGFKQAYFPEFLKRRFRVRQRQIFTETKFIHVCPHLRIQSREDEKYHMQFLMPEGDLTRGYNR